MTKTFKRDFIVNWKTTSAAIVAFLAVVAPQVQMLFDGVAETNPDWNIVVGAVGILLAGIFARDADKSSQDSGVRP